MSKMIKRKYYGDSTNTPIAETIEETIPDNSDERIFELEKQLHEQYAVNNNSNVGTLVSLIGALLVVMTGYGYVLYQYRTSQCDDIAIVNLSAIIAMAVMMLLYCISVSLGANQRMEQFITFAIRAKHYNADRYKEIFPENYYPFEKDFSGFVQGLYNLWSKVMIVTIAAIAMSHYYLVAKTCVVLVFGLLFILFSLMFRCSRYKKYIDREQSEHRKHNSFIKEIKQDEIKLCICEIVCNTVMCVVVISFLIFLVTNAIFDKEDYRIQDTTRDITINLNYNDITKQNK